MDMSRFEWLAQRVEPAIDPDRRIVDAHHHLWTERAGSTYLAPDLLADITHSHNIVKTVYIDALSSYDTSLPTHLQPVGEVRFVVDQAEQTQAAGGPTIAAIVGHADLRLGNAVGEVLAALDEAGGGRFRGVRHPTTWHDGGGVPMRDHRQFESMMADAAFRSGLATLGAMGFSYDAWLFHSQLSEFAAMAAALPDVPMVLNHLGGPLGVGMYADRRADVRGEWQPGMREVAACPNVVLKLGGFGMDMYYGMGFDQLPMPPSSEEVAAYWGDDVRWCIDLFGPDRCMFESNFPVDRQCLPYAVLWNAAQIMANNYTEAEQDQLFAGTAERVYRIRNG